MAVALALALLLVVLAVISLRNQWRQRIRLRSRAMIAVDERRYFGGQVQRRTLNAVLMLVLAGMIGWTYLSGDQQRLESIAKLDELDPPQKPTDDDKEFVRQSSIYWLVVLALLFTVVLIAVVDYLAVSLYARQEIRRMQTEHRELLERDLAVHRQQQLNDRMRRIP